MQLYYIGLDLVLKLAILIINKMNIAEILKDCPKGTRLYSPIYGEVRYLYIDTNSKYPIIGESDSDDCTITFTSDGRLNANYDGECMLFPSKENRNWSTFKVPEKRI